MDAVPFWCEGGIYEYVRGGGKPVTGHTMGESSRAAYRSCWGSADTGQGRLYSITWENTTLDARNEITGYLATQHSNDDQRWNVMAQKVGKTIDDELIPLLPPLITDDSRVLNSVKWDVMAFLMEDIYKDKIKMPLFFKSLIGVYEAGHIPCGWDGEWPKGRLVVY